MKFNKLKQCPICDSFNILKISSIKSPIEKINKVFDLMKCKKCLHRFISKVPSQIELNKLYEIDSQYVFGGTFQELDQKKKFIKNKFEDIKPQFDHWIFKHVEPITGKYFELGPGLCRLYRTFYLKGWICQGLEPRSFIKSNGIKKDINELQIQLGSVKERQVESLNSNIRLQEKASEAYALSKESIALVKFTPIRGYRKRVLFC